MQSGSWYLDTNPEVGNLKFSHDDLSKHFSIFGFAEQRTTGYDEQLSTIASQRLKT